MRRVNEFDPEIPDLDNIVRLYPMDQYLAEHLVFFETFFGQGDRKTRGINRQIEFLEDVGQCPDVVFVAVREDDRGQVVAIFFEKIEIRNRYVDAIRRFLGKAHAGVDDDHLIGVPDAHAVHPEFADPAQGNYLNFIQ